MNTVTAAAIAARSLGEPVTITQRQAQHSPTVWQALQAGTGLNIVGGGIARPSQFGSAYSLVFPGGFVFPAQDAADAAAAIAAHYTHLATINN